MKLECEKLIYREKRQFTIQCVITAACYHHREVYIYIYNPHYYTTNNIINDRKLNASVILFLLYLYFRFFYRTVGEHSIQIFHQLHSVLECVDKERGVCVILANNYGQVCPKNIRKCLATCNISRSVNEIVFLHCHCMELSS